MNSKLRIGHFRDFKGEPQMILFSGDKESIHKLEEFFHNLSEGTLQSVRLDQLDFVSKFHNLEIDALLADKNFGIKRGKKENSFSWSLSSETWETFAKLISVFRSGMSGHHYLNCFSEDNTRIMVSLGEYSDDWVGWTN